MRFFSQWLSRGLRAMSWATLAACSGTNGASVSPPPLDSGAPDGHDVVPAGDSGADTGVVDAVDAGPSGCENGPCLPDVLVGSAQKAGPFFAVDNASLYWMKCDAADRPRLMKSAKGPTAAAQPIADLDACFSDSASTMLVSDDSVYFRLATTKISQIDKNTGNTRTLVAGRGGSSNVGVAGRSLYFNKDGTDRIYAISLSGGSESQITTDDDAYGSYALGALAVDTENLYVAGRRHSGGQEFHMFRQGPAKDAKATDLGRIGSYPTMLAVTNAGIVGFSSASAFGVDCNDPRKQVTISLMPKSGGTEKVLASQDMHAFAFAIAVDTENVYWQDACDGAPWKVSLGGGTPVKMAPGKGQPGRSLAVDGRYLYFKDPDGIKRVPK